ncbi:MAG: hypothetical protein LWX07_02590 [Bacteroidetes bacterium]|nr:hypothetical protein [Bacteroidota bacterium]
MALYRIFSLIAFLVCFVSLAYHLIRLIRLDLPKDYSIKKGNLTAAIAYSYTGAMNPVKKESAFMHYPTYTAGIFYHTGTFISFVLFFLFHLNTGIPAALHWPIVILLTVSAASGLGIFIKRASLKKLRYLSNPDDYVSNLLVTVFQAFTLIALIDGAFAPYYYIAAGLLFLYLPLGKLKHSIYFFAARYHLGFFYGWRGIWPAGNEGRTK